jgi:mono/diheme cytochrome c family protein
MRWLISAVGLMALTGCEIPSEFLQRMESQSKYEYYETSEFWADGRAMRAPPEGTIPREAVVGNPGLSTGRVNGALVTAIPMPVDKPLLLLGQKKFNIVCSQCHGVLGDGNSIVAENMGLRLPPSLLELSGKPAGHFYAAINEGYGVMPSFNGELNTQERWAVVAYVRALQAARGAPAGAQPLPPQENR